MFNICFHDYQRVGVGYKSVIINEYGIYLIGDLIDNWITYNEICLKCGKIKDNISKIKTQESRFLLKLDEQRKRAKKAQKMLEFNLASHNNT